MAGLQEVTLVQNDPAPEVTINNLEDLLKNLDIDPFDELSKFLTTGKYARHIDDLDRREVWDEIVDRVRDMHLQKFSHLSEDRLQEIREAFEYVRRQEVVPSMRSLQFGGPATFAHNARLFNCSVRHIDSLRSFAEVFYLLLCGCGVTIGVNDKYLSRIPRLASPEDKTGTIITYVVEDTIEGWADSIEALLNCYFHNTGYTGRKIVFDYSKIRPKGSPLKTGGGRAPGYEGLKQSHQRIKALMDLIIEKRGQERLKTVDAYDIVMHCADAVLSGGIRRAATAAIFEDGDDDMLNAKGMLPVTNYYGFYKSGKSYRGRVDVDGKDVAVSLSKPEYKQLKNEKVIAWYHVEPQRARSNNSILLLRGSTEHEKFKKVFETTRLYGEPGFVFGEHEDQLFNPCQPGFAPVLTPDGIRKFDDIDVGSKIWSETGWTTVVKKWSTGVKPVYAYSTSNGVFYGTENHRILSGGVKTEVKDATSIDTLLGPVDDVAQSAYDGILELNCPGLPYAMHKQIELSSIGLLSRIVAVGQAYKLVIMRDDAALPEDMSIVDIEFLGEMEVFDITVDNEPHTYWTGGLNVSNCYEVGFIPVTADGICGVEFCNLTSVNGSKTRDQEHFLRQCWAASLIGTLQAAYTDYPYLSKAARDLTEEEALLGVSITGILDNWDFFSDANTLKSGAIEVKDTNLEWANTIGTNPAARTTLVKPEGTSSLVLKSASGIHAHHATPIYFRRVQVNKNDPVYQFFRLFNPHMAEESVWSATGSDDVITFPIITPEGAMSKEDLNAMKHLEIIKFIQENWVVPGTSDYNKKPIHHNVSATVDVEDDEWDKVVDYVYENRHAFSALSFLPKMGDKIYRQAPLEKVVTDEDAQRFYRLVKDMRPVDYTMYRESEDLTAMTETVSCAGGACEIDYDPSKAKK